MSNNSSNIGFNHLKERRKQRKKQRETKQRTSTVQISTYFPFPLIFHCAVLALSGNIQSNGYAMPAIQNPPPRLLDWLWRGVARIGVEWLGMESAGCGLSMFPVFYSHRCDGIRKWL